MYVLAGGTSGSSDLPPFVRNSYSVLQFNNSAIACRVRELDPEGNHSGTFAEIKLPVRAVISM
jgi:hypothetical protein